MTLVQAVQQGQSDKVVLGRIILDRTGSFTGWTELEPLLKRRALRELVDTKKVEGYEGQWKSVDICGISVTEFEIKTPRGISLMRVRSGELSFASDLVYHTFENGARVALGRDRTSSGSYGLWTAYLSESGPVAVVKHPTILNTGLSRMQMYVNKRGNGGLFVANLGYEPLYLTSPEQPELVVTI